MFRNFVFVALSLGLTTVMIVGTGIQGSALLG